MHFINYDQTHLLNDFNFREINKRSCNFKCFIRNMIFMSFVVRKKNFGTWKINDQSILNNNIKGVLSSKANMLGGFCFIESPFCIFIPFSVRRGLSLYNHLHVRQDLFSLHSKISIAKQIAQVCISALSCCYFLF